MTTAQQFSPFLLDLNSPLATLERVGGKGASLARLVAGGLPVPPGFHITTAVYERFVDENHLGDGILAAVAQARASDPATLDRASEQIQSLIAQGTIPGDIAEAIQQQYAELGADVPVAVRSSATAEDLPDMSFAGQLETYLNIRGSDEVMKAVKRCWASLWTGRAIGYRQRQGIRPEDVSIAVVVQQLVAAQAAGVLFTANPVTGARDELMINAAWGLGEAIVSGRVSVRAARRYVWVRWLTRAMLERISACAMQTDADAVRIVALGAPSARVKVVGSLKFARAAGAGA